MKIFDVRSALNDRNYALQAFKKGTQNLLTNYFIEYENDLINKKRNLSEILKNEVENEMLIDYTYISLDEATKILIDIGENLNSEDIIKYIYTEEDVTILYYSFNKIWEFIRQLDEVEFFIGALSCIVNIKNTHILHKLFTTQILNLIFDLKLEQAYKIVEKRKSVFVAMWFDSSMENARIKICKAINDSGFKPILIDQKEHNNQIVPEIFYEIKGSSFIIADLTGQRNGVYYEAGYAEALGKTVILTCKDSEKTHFDVAQKNTIFWDTEEDLYKKLTSRIVATYVN